MAGSGAAGTLPAALRLARLVFWDFDGVVKESVDVKTEAFAALFAWAGADVAAAVAAHHRAHGGMSRFEKIPRYLHMAGEIPSDDRVRQLCDEFGQLVFQKVIDASWVPGAEAYLRGNPWSQNFVLVSATPQDELVRIVEALRLRDAFTAVHGAPTTKADAVRHTLAMTGIDARSSVFLGDARADWQAAIETGVPFVLRRHGGNGELFADYTGPSITGLE